MKFLAIILLAASAVQAAPADCHLLRHRGKRVEARVCYQELALSRDAYLRAEGAWGLADYTDANNQFRAAVAAAPKNAGYRVRWGRLLLERFNRAEAATLFQEALEIDPKHAGAFLGLALVASEGYESKAVEFARKALEDDPKLVEAQELLASLALEDSNPAKAMEEADKALQLSTEALDAMAVRAAVEQIADRPYQGWVEKIAKVNPVYGRAHASIAHHLVMNRRYEDAIAQYRRAIELEPDFWEARSELGINLMRLGLEQEAREQLELAYENGYKDSATTNTLRLMDSYKNFVTYKTGNTIVRLHKKEAELLRPYFEEELKKAIGTFEKKYKVRLPRPVQLEVYPDHEDFAVRTMGMPGLGALGVTFGDVVAMDSPSGRKPGTFHWASTLWHELSHVFVLTATRQRVPRWFTEGLAVHEETAVSQDWGDRVTPEILVAVRDKKLLPVRELDRGFIRPSYPGQIIVSYFQAGRVCDYIAGKWGFEKLLEMMHAFAERKTTAEVVSGLLGMQPEEFDKEFLAWVEKDLGKTVSGLDEFRKRLKVLANAAKQGKYDEVLSEGPSVRELYPDYVEGANAYEFIADAHLAKGNKGEAMRVLENYAKVGGRNPAVLKKLAGLQEELGKTSEAAATLNRINYIYPVNDEDLHRRLGELWLAQKNFPGAIREFGAVVALRPVDKAAAHYNLARAYSSASDTGQAEEQLLFALEAAPSYRPAQKMLLQLHDQVQGKAQDTPLRKQ
ncbi:MAG: tetratricopeptide repeat protein [Acidobacteriia bacterium]|nr:tetratricopeptide repeat protein [Terriglobia bacterium]